ncbi:MAG: BMP family ABC transporter substrate-binding protein [Selenomonadaceae bacterium]|nr:BMP family ABC transporter substrate-binding protein [Selenomonadaceae bacterium]
MKLLTMLNKYRIAVVLAIIFLLMIPFVTMIFDFAGTEKVRHEKIGLIILGDTKINGWNSEHYNGIKSACEKFGLELLLREKVRENSGECPLAIKELAEEGVGMIFLASYAYSREVKDLVREYPNIAFATNSAEVHDNNLTSYFARLYQARYLSGALAGMRTKSNVIGYVAAMPNTEVQRGINAFTLGVQRTNPNAKVVVMWTGSWQNEKVEAEHAKRLIKEAGADVLTYHQDEDATAQVAEEFGVDFIAYNEILNGYSDHYLTSVVCIWELYYSDMIRRYLKGELNSIDNHWLGIEHDAVMLSDYSPRVSSEMVTELNSLKQELKNDKLIFSGQIYDNKGQLRCENGEAISDDTLLENINWLVKGVEVLE